MKSTSQAITLTIVISISCLNILLQFNQVICEVAEKGTTKLLTKIREKIWCFSTNSALLELTHKLVELRFLCSKSLVEPEKPLKSWKEIPGPSSLPLLGQMLHFLPGGSQYNLNGMEILNKLHNDHGAIVRFGGFLGLPNFILLYDAESCAQILRGENWLPYRPGIQPLQYYRHHIKSQNDKKITGLFTKFISHGETWKRFRSTVNPVMLHQKTLNSYTPILTKISNDMITKLRSTRDENNQIRGNLSHEMNLWSLESVAVISLGCRLNCLDDDIADPAVKRLIEVSFEALVISNELDYRPSLWKLYATPTFKRAMKLFEEQDLLSKHFIDKATKELKSKNNTDDEKGILEKLLHIDKDMAYILASDMLFAGTDTVSNTMTATLYLLAKNLEKQEKLRLEVLSKEEKKPYLKACLKESMRMMPVFTGNVRVLTKDYNVMGYRIPKDTYVLCAHQNMSMMEKYFPRAHEFLPERWLAGKDDPLSYKNSHPFAFSPFGFGVRNCIGRRITELQLEIFLARLMENFHVEWFGPPINIDATTINYLKGPFNFIFKDV